MTGSSSEKLLSNLGKGARAAFRSVPLRLFFFPPSSSKCLCTQSKHTGLGSRGRRACPAALQHPCEEVKGQFRATTRMGHTGATSGGLGRRRLVRWSREKSGDFKKDLRPANQEMRNSGIPKRRKHLTAAGDTPVGGTGVKPGLN